MAAAIIAAITALLGVALGGGVRAWETNQARQKEAAAVLCALCSEVEAITRLASHRKFLEGFQAMRALNGQLVAQGHGNAPAQWLVINLAHDYFSAFSALTPKLGLLHPYFADRITRFYTYAKAVSENYRVDSPLQTDTTAAAAVEALDNDILLMQTMLILGAHISTFRPIVAPAGIIDPFPQLAAAEEEAQRQALARGVEPELPKLAAPDGFAGG